MHRFALTWWIRFPIPLRRVNKLLSEAWIDGVYLTAGPGISLAAPLLLFLFGLFEGATHWTIHSVFHGYAFSHVVDFTQMLPLLFVAAICGALSSQLGLLLVLGFALGDLFIGGQLFIHGPGFAWNLLHAYSAQLVCYLAFFLLAVTPALTAKAMAGNLPRWLRGRGTPYLWLAAVIGCGVQGISVYAWTVAATMIVRVHWLWAGITPPFAVFDFIPQVDPWLPITATVAMGCRFWLLLQARGKLNSTAIVAARRQMMALDRQSPALTKTVIGVIGTALVSTAIISGFFDSISRGLAIFILIAGLFIVRSLILPNVKTWVWWSRLMNRIPLVLRWAGVVLATFALTRQIVSNPRWSPQFVNVPGAFGVEISCFFLGLVISIVLLPLPLPKLAESPRMPKTLQTGARVIALVCVLGLTTRSAFAGICLDPFCCFGASGLLAALAVVALLLAALPFIFGIVELGIVADLLFDAVMAIAPESAATTLMRVEAEASLASEAAALAAVEGTEITAEGLAAVIEHLSNPVFTEIGQNTMMIQRLTAVLESGELLTGADANFYIHELYEAELMAGGMDAETAHEITLEALGQNPLSIYAREVVEAFPSVFNSSWRKFWGLVIL